MNVFWRDPNGNHPPDNAIFALCPFTKKAPFFHPSMQIKKLPPPTSPIRVIKRTLVPEKKAWEVSVTKALSAIRENLLSKVVLARCCILECETKPDPLAITAKLVEKSQNSTVFCFQEGSKAFLGASPELLFSRKGKYIQTEAIAGTCVRGKGKKEDRKLENKLLKNEKTLREISPVIDHIKLSLNDFCSTPLTISPIQVKKTQNVQHLYAKGEGNLRENISELDIFHKLHPTPALCGFPLLEAKEWIQKEELFDRDLYGGIVGWTNEEVSTYVVAIRCCLIHDHTVKLYTGAGIVDGSNPDEEWEELNSKLKLYEGIFV